MADYSACVVCIQAKIIYSHYTVSQLKPGPNSSPFFSSCVCQLLLKNFMMMMMMMYSVTQTVW